MHPVEALIDPRSAAAGGDHCPVRFPPGNATDAGEGGPGCGRGRVYCRSGLDPGQGGCGYRRSALVESCPATEANGGLMRVDSVQRRVSSRGRWVAASSLRVALIAVVALSVTATGCAPDSGETPETPALDPEQEEAGMPDPVAEPDAALEGLDDSGSDPVAEPDAALEGLDDSGSDPAPEGLGVVQREVLGASGGVVEVGGVVVRVPAGAAGEPVEVEVREPLGVFGSEEGGAVVGIDHDGPLAEPVTVSWDVSHLSDARQNSILVVRWNEDLEGWLPVDVDYEITSGVLTAEIAQWSWASWITGLEDFAANFSQTVQEILGRRVDAPRCSGELPEWVTNTTQPDEGSNAAAIRLCYEPRDSGSVTMKMANNRVFSQFVYSTTPGVWGDEVEGPDPAVSLVGVLHQAAHKVLSDDTRVFMPPLTQAAVSIERPQGTVPWHITFERDHDAQSFLADVAFFAASALPTPSGAETFGYIQVYLTVLFECSVVRVTEEAAGAQGAWEIFTAAVRATASCAEDMSEPFSDQHRKLTSRIAKQSLSESEFKRLFGAEAARKVAGALRALKIGEAIGYFIDLAAEEWVESTTWSMTITGRSASLGGWDPTCSNPAGDSNRLFRNLVLREPYTPVGGTTRDELHTFDDWRTSAERAVAPLQDCGDSHNTYVAADVDDWFGGQEQPTTAIVRDLILAMVTPDPTGGYTAVAAGGSHSCGLRPDRAVACWGSNADGQLLEPDRRVQRHLSWRRPQLRDPQRRHRRLLGLQQREAVERAGCAVHCRHRGSESQLRDPQRRHCRLLGRLLRCGLRRQRQVLHRRARHGA